MGYYLTVISGADEGQTFLIEEDEVVIGRSPSAQFVLKDESVAWEHAVIRRENGKCVINNLSAAGTRLRGKKITTPTRLLSQDEIELSDSCRLLLVEEAESSGRPSALVLIVAGLALVLLLGAGAAYAVYAFSQPVTRAVTPAHWRAAYTRLDDRLEQWTSRGYITPRALVLYRNAWRLEQVSNFHDAASNWEELNSLLLTQRSPDLTIDDLTMAESASPTQKALNVYMGYDPSATPFDYEWATDDAAADALVWFVRKRSVMVRAQATEAGQTGKKKQR